MPSRTFLPPCRTVHGLNRDRAWLGVSCTVRHCSGHCNGCLERKQLTPCRCCVDMRVFNVQTLAYWKLEKQLRLASDQLQSKAEEVNTLTEYKGNLERGTCSPAPSVASLSACCQHPSNIHAAASWLASCPHPMCHSAIVAGSPGDPGGSFGAGHCTSRWCFCDQPGSLL